MFTDLLGIPDLSIKAKLMGLVYIAFIIKKCIGYCKHLKRRESKSTIKHV